MPRPFTLLVPVVLLAGCAKPPAAEVAVSPAATVADATYPARTDWLVDQSPTVTPKAVNLPGFPPLKSLTLVRANKADALPDSEKEQAATLAPEVNKNLLDPVKEISEGDRKKLTAAVAAGYGTPLAPTAPGLDPAVLAHGAGVYRRWCASCHGPAGGGDGPAATTLLPPPRDYRSGLFKFVTSTPATPGKPLRADLARTIRRGIDGTAMPAFPQLSDADLDAVVGYVIHLSARGETEYQAMKRLIKALEEADTPEKEAAAASKKVADAWAKAEGVIVPADPAATDADKLAAAVRGHQLFTDPKTGAGCASCHLDYGRKPNLKYDQWGNVAQPRNLFLGLYRGGRSPEELYARIYSGIAGSGMPSHKPLVDGKGTGEGDKIWDLVHFVRLLGTAAGRSALRGQGVKLE